MQTNDYNACLYKNTLSVTGYGWQVTGKRDLSSITCHLSR